MTMLHWCDEKDCKKMRPMTLKMTTVKNVLGIEAWACDICGHANWLPASSVRKFLDGCLELLNS
jgi:hypothetical protein